MSAVTYEIRITRWMLARAFWPAAIDVMRATGLLASPRAWLIAARRFVIIVALGAGGVP